MKEAHLYRNIQGASTLPDFSSGNLDAVDLSLIGHGGELNGDLATAIRCDGELFRDGFIRVPTCFAPAFPSRPAALPGRRGKGGISKEMQIGEMLRWLPC